MRDDAHLEIVGAAGKLPVSLDLPGGGIVNAIVNNGLLVEIKVGLLEVHVDGVPFSRHFAAHFRPEAVVLLRAESAVCLIDSAAKGGIAVLLGDLHAETDIGSVPGLWRAVVVRVGTGVCPVQINACVTLAETSGLVSVVGRAPGK